MADPEQQHLLPPDVDEGGLHDDEALDDGEGNGILELFDLDPEDALLEDAPDIVAIEALRRGEITEEQYHAAANNLPLNLPFLLNRVS